MSNATKTPEQLAQEAEAARQMRLALPVKLPMNGQAFVDRLGGCCPFCNALNLPSDERGRYCNLCKQAWKDEYRDGVLVGYDPHYWKKPLRAEATPEVGSA